MERKNVIGVIGGGEAIAPPDSKLYNLAIEVGRLIAEKKCVLLCGGRTGIMEAAASGARKNGGHTIGVMPGRKGDEKPNAYIDCAIFTGLGDARNYVNAYASEVIIAMKGGPGTLSEIALALKLNKTVICLGYWKYLQRAGFRVEWVKTPAAAVDMAFANLGTAGKSKYPRLRTQEKQKVKFDRFLKKISKAPLESGA